MRITRKYYFWVMLMAVFCQMDAYAMTSNEWCALTPMRPEEAKQVSARLDLKYPNQTLYEQINNLTLGDEKYDEITGGEGPTLTRLQKLQTELDADYDLTAAVGGLKAKVGGNGSLVSQITSLDDTVGSMPERSGHSCLNT